MDESPYHEGERALQTRLGMREKIEHVGRRVIRDFMPDEHRHFFAQLPWLLVGWLDEAKRPWASALTGEPGFVSSPDARTLVIAPTPAPGDNFNAHLAVGAPLGLLGIELPTRRRNRVNGTIVAMADARLEVRVDQSFGNCPKYINRRRFAERTSHTPAPLVATSKLTDGQRRVIERADTLFIASSYIPNNASHRRYGVDVSHRGGRPGFVRIEADGSVSIPDYLGNFAFNTLGNIDRNGQAGLLFVDFDGGDLLQVTGDARIDWDAPETNTATGVQRLLRVHPRELRLLPAAFPFTATILDYSPNLDSIDTI